MDSDEFAKLLMSPERKEWQDPEEIVDQINVVEGSSVVDLGSGPGYFTIPFSKRLGPKGKIYAVDQDPVILQHLTNQLDGASSNRASVILAESDVTNTEISKHSIDLVFFANLLHDLKDPKKFFDEVKRILKDNGRLVDIDWQKMETNEMGPPL
jgi:ubiquinone/menaquinone biosynthesis C-methylase UbiE